MSDEAENAATHRVVERFRSANDGLAKLQNELSELGEQMSEFGKALRNPEKRLRNQRQ